MVIAITNIRYLWDHLIFIMGIPILVRWHLYTGKAPSHVTYISYSRHDQTIVRMFSVLKMYSMVILWGRYSTVHYIVVKFLKKYQQKTSPSYGLSFVDPASGWYSASVPVIINAISYYNRLHYNGTQLYLVSPHTKVQMIFLSNIHNRFPP